MIRVVFLRQHRGQITDKSKPQEEEEEGLILHLLETKRQIMPYIVKEGNKKMKWHVRQYRSSVHPFVVDRIENEKFRTWRRSLDGN